MGDGAGLQWAAAWAGLGSRRLGAGWSAIASDLNAARVPAAHGGSAIACLSVATLGLFATPASASAASTQPSVRPCTVGGLPAKCGALQVPEDRASGNGCMITVGFVVTPAAMASDRLPDPVVYFAGGP